MPASPWGGRTFALFTNIIMTLMFLTQTSAKGSVQSDIIEGNGVRFQISNERKSWFEARDSCNASGGELLRVEDRIAFLHSLNGNISGEFWIQYVEDFKVNGLILHYCLWLILDKDLSSSGNPRMTVHVGAPSECQSEMKYICRYKQTMAPTSQETVDTATVPVWSLILAVVVAVILLIALVIVFMKSRRFRSVQQDVQYEIANGPYVPQMYDVPGDSPKPDRPSVYEVPKDDNGVPERPMDLTTVDNGNIASSGGYVKMYTKEFNRPVKSEGNIHISSTSDSKTESKMSKPKLFKNTISLGKDNLFGKKMEQTFSKEITENVTPPVKRKQNKEKEVMNSFFKNDEDLKKHGEERGRKRQQIQRKLDVSKHKADDIEKEDDNFENENNKADHVATDQSYEPMLLYENEDGSIHVH